jgi:hypothetical protein
MEHWSDPDPGSGIKHPGSTTLVQRHERLDVMARVVNGDINLAAIYETGWWPKKY